MVASNGWILDEPPIFLLWPQASAVAITGCLKVVTGKDKKFNLTSKNNDYSLLVCS